MDENRANDELKEKILSFISNKHPECDFIDYKLKWQNKKYELIKDIFSFTNTTHNKDCYLIYGVDDNLNITGVEKNQENRRDQKDITDILTNQVKISGDMIPPISVSTIIYESHKIDVLTVKNNMNVPVYLSKEFHDKGKGYAPKSIYQGQIFTREGSRNTPINETANFNQVEYLWRKRLGIGRPIMERYSNVIKDVKHWKSSYDEQEYGYSFMYDLDPNFRILLSDANEGKLKLQPYSLDLFHQTVDWQDIKLIYNNTIVYSSIGVYIDQLHGFMIVPNSLIINHNFECSYFIKGNFDYELNNLLFQTVVNNNFNQYGEGKLHIKEYKRIINKTLILFESKNEKDKFNEYINSKFSKDFEKTDETYSNYIEHARSIIPKENVNESNKETVAKEYSSARFFKEIFDKWKESNQK